MDVGDHGVSVRDIVLKLGNDIVGFCDAVTDVINGCMRISR